MEIVPEVHLEEWDLEEGEDINIFTRGILKITEDHNKKLSLHILSKEGSFFEVKEIDNYWELRAYDNFLNQNFNEDEDDVSYHEDFSMYVRDIYNDSDYLIISRGSNEVYGASNIFCDEGWSDDIIEDLWDKGEILIINISDELFPTVYSNEGWLKIDSQILTDLGTELKTRQRENKIDQILDI